LPKGLLRILKNRIALEKTIYEYTAGLKMISVPDPKGGSNK